MVAAIIAVVVSALALPGAGARPSEDKQVVCSSDIWYWGDNTTHICYWAAPEDGQFIFNMHGLDHATLLSLRWCRQAPTKTERTGTAGEAYLARCEALYQIKDPEETCAKECLASECIDCDEEQTVYQIYASRVCLRARHCPGADVTLNIPNSLNEEHCAVELLNDQQDGDGKICLPWKDECASGGWFNCVCGNNRKLRMAREAPPSVHV